MSDDLEDLDYNPGLSSLGAWILDLKDTVERQKKHIAHLQQALVEQTGQGVAEKAFGFTAPAQPKHQWETGDTPLTFAQASPKNDPKTLTEVLTVTTYVDREAFDALRGSRGRREDEIKRGQISHLFVELQKKGLIRQFQRDGGDSSTIYTTAIEVAKR
jgi:hypothetical protein